MHDLAWTVGLGALALAIVGALIALWRVSI